MIDRRMEPILRGQVRQLDDSTTVWEGRWGMNLIAFSEENSSQLNVFRYTTSTKPTFSVGDSISFKGFFEVNAVNKGSKSQFTDKALELHVVSEDADEGKTVKNVQGRGSNRFGAFELKGKYDPTTGTLEVTRVYAPRSVPGQKLMTRSQSGEHHPKVESDPESPNESGSKGKSNFQPQSPSSPTEVQVTPSKYEPASPKRLSPSEPPFYTEAKSLLKDLMGRDTNQWFSIPVDPQALGLRDYASIVKSPMDLGTIQAKLDAKEYSSWDECFGDLCLTFENALMYNPRGSNVYNAALDLKNYLTERVSRIGKLKASVSKLATSAIGKREHKKKQIFEPGGGGLKMSNLQTGTASKKTPKSAKNKTKAMLSAANAQTTKKSKTAIVSSVKRIKIISSNLGPEVLISTGEENRMAQSGDLLASGMFFNPIMNRTQTGDDDDVHSFDDLDDTAFAIATPPPTVTEGGIDATPLSSAPLIGGDYDAFALPGTMSPTDLDVATFD